MKKVLSIILSFVMLFSLTAGMDFSAYAASEPEIKIDEKVNISISAVDRSNKKKRHVTYFVKFIPDETAMYEFTLSDMSKLTEGFYIEGVVVEGKKDPWVISSGKIKIYDRYDDSIAIVPKDRPRSNYSYAVELQENKEYYFALVEGWGKDSTGSGEYSVDLSVKKGHTCSYFKDAVYCAYDGDGCCLEPEDGRIFDLCLACGNETNIRTIYYPSYIKLSKNSFVYDGKPHKPEVIAVYDREDNIIPSSEYTVEYYSNEPYHAETDFTNVGCYEVCVSFNGNLYTGALIYFYSIAPKPTKITEVSAKSAGFTVKWKKQAEQTTGYQIKYSTNKDFKDAKYVTVKGTDNLSKTVSNLEGNKTYYIKVRTYKYFYYLEEEYYMDDYFLKSSHSHYSSWSDTVTVKTKPKSTSIKSLTSKSKGFTVKWNKQTSGTDGYQIKYSTDKNFKKATYVTVKGIKNTSKTIKNLESNTKYYVKVRTYKDVNGERFYSFWSSTKSVTTNQPKGTELTSVSAQSKGFKAKWKKQSGIKGYQIKYSTASDFKNAKYVTVKGADSSAKTVKNLKGNKKYFVKVRTYKMVDGKKCYSKWSKAKTVTTKK